MLCIALSGEAVLSRMGLYRSAEARRGIVGLGSRGAVRMIEADCGDGVDRQSRPFGAGWSTEVKARSSLLLFSYSFDCDGIGRCLVLS